MGITEIIRQGLANGDSYDVINKTLADAGFNIKLVEGHPAGWTEKEMEDGFIQESGEVPDAVHLADLMNRNTELAGKDLTAWCAEGRYKVTYDDNGYAVKAVKV